MALLEIRDLVVRYGEIEALRGISINVEEGQVVTLLGANGAGKSTTLRAISGLAKPAAGLNSSEKLELHELLKRIAAQGLTILIIDHDMTLVSEAAQHITVLNFGRRIADGESMAVLRHPDVVSAYLGTE